MSQIKRYLGLALKIVLVAVISFLLLEFLLLIFNDVLFRNSFYIYDPDLGFKVRPHFRWGENITNEFGFNDHDYPHQHQPGTYRILILSDSFNWAGGLEGNYTAILERKFAAEFGEGRVEVITAGYSATHTGEQLELLKKYGLQYNPDLVVLGFFVGNDFIDANPYRRRIAVAGTTIDIDTRTDREIILFGQLLIPQSRLYLFIKERWATYKYLQTHQTIQADPLKPPMLEQSTATPEVTDGQAYTAAYLQLELTRMQMSNWAYAPEFQQNEAYIFNRLLEMRDLLAGKNIDFTVAAYPDEYQVVPALRQAVAKKFNFETYDYQWDRPQGLLWQFCTDNNIEYYDLLPAFKAAYKSGQRLYLPSDSHWNEAGNRLAAQLLYDELVWKVREHLN